MSSTNKHREIIPFDFEDGTSISSLAHPDLIGLPNDLRLAAEAALYCISTLTTIRWTVRDIRSGKVKRTKPKAPEVFSSGDPLHNLESTLHHMLAWMGPRFEALQSQWRDSRSTPFKRSDYNDMLSADATTAHTAVYDLTRWVCASLVQEREGRLRLKDMRIPDADCLLTEVIAEACGAAADVNTKDDSYITGKEAAALTGMTLSTLSKLCKKGGPIRSYKPTKNSLYVHAADLGRYMAKRSGIT